MQNEHDGINVDSEVIISEYRLLFMKYSEQIQIYKEAIANLSLKQIINNEEEAWVQHRLQHEEIHRQTHDASAHNRSVLDEQVEKIIVNVRAYEFEEEISQLTEQLKDKIKSLKKDYRDLKMFQNEKDIKEARDKLMVFIRKLITDTNSLIATIKKNYQKNLDVIEKDKKE